MTPPDTDARFEDAPLSDRPLRLRAESADDLAVISSLVQDAVGKAGDIAWMPKKRRLVVLVHRFRWEDSAGAAQAHRPFERVRSAVTGARMLKVAARAGRLPMRAPVAATRTNPVDHPEHRAAPLIPSGFGRWGVGKEGS